LAKVEIKLIALHSRTEADAMNFKIFPVTLAHTLNHVPEQTLGGAMHGAGVPLLVLANNGNVALILIELNAFRKLPRKLALRALNKDAPIFGHLNGDFVWNGNGLFADAGHGFVLL
jgi:hypothetical protein